MHSGADRSVRTSWSSVLSRTAAAILLFELLSGLAITFGPFHPAVEWGVLLHTDRKAIDCGESVGSMKIGKRT